MAARGDVIVREGPFTRAQRDELPGDGRRHEPVAWELRDGAYCEAGRCVGDQSWTGSAPFSVTIVPSRLLDDQDEATT